MHVRANQDIKNNTPTKIRVSRADVYAYFSSQADNFRRMSNGAR